MSNIIEKLNIDPKDKVRDSKVRDADEELESNSRGFAPPQDTEETLVEHKRRDAPDDPKWAAPEEPMSEDRPLPE